MEELLSAISTCGFPIIMCLLEGYYIISRADKITSVLENNTKALQELALKLGECNKEGND